MSTDRLIVFDTTMRDGEQSPGASMTRDEKLRIARLLEKMRVDVIEAGFPIASPGDFEAVRSVAEAIKEDLGVVKDVLDIFVRTGMSNMEELTPQLDMLKKITANYIGKNYR